VILNGALLYETVIQYSLKQRGNTDPTLLLLPVLDATKDYAREEKQTHNMALQVPLGTIIAYISSNKWLR